MQRFPFVASIAAQVVEAGRRLAVFVRSREGVSTIEYALITVAVIAIVGGAIGLLSGGFNDLFGDLNNELGNAVSNMKKAATS